MSAITYGNELLRDVWPSFIGQRRLEALDWDTARGWQLIPTTIEGLFRWATLVPAGRDSTGATRHKLVYKASEEHPEAKGRFEVRVRLQGFIESQAIGPLGDWNGTSKACPRAHQTLVLSAGPCQDTFVVQTTVLNNIRQMVLRFLGCKSDDGPISPLRIELKRTLFTKVTARNQGSLASALQLPDDDPHELASAVKEQWIVSHRIGCYVEDDNCDTVPTTHLILCPGDFVDVAATVQIRTRYKKGKKHTEVTFEPTDVMRLRSKAELEELNIIGTEDGVEGAEDEPELMAVPSGF